MTWRDVVTVWRLQLMDLDLPEFDGVHFIDVPTHLVEAGDPPRLDWWPFPPWPNATALADQHGLGQRYGPGAQCTLHMLYEAGDDEQAVIAVLLRASLRQLYHYPPREWHGAHPILLELQRLVDGSGVRVPDLRWFGTIKMTLPLQLFRSDIGFRRPTELRELVQLIALEHAYILNRYYPVRAVPLSTVAIAPKPIA